MNKSLRAQPTMTEEELREWEGKAEAGTLDVRPIHRMVHEQIRERLEACPTAPLFPRGFLTEIARDLGCTSDIVWRTARANGFSCAQINGQLRLLTAPRANSRKPETILRGS